MKGKIVTKPGRPRKGPPVNAVVKKNQTKIDLEKAELYIVSLKGDINTLETRLDQAYTEQEKLFKELDKLIYLVIHHCSEVECNAGKLTMHDIDYCVDLIKRILKNKFEYKPQMD